MRRTKQIVAAAAVFYILALAVGWQVGRVWVDCKTRRLLDEARNSFSNRIESQVEAVQWYAADIICEHLARQEDGSCLSIDRMQALADAFMMAEINIIGTNGVCTASNLPEVLGYDFHRNPDCARFLDLFDPSNRVFRLSQPFRRGAVNTRFYCKYFGLLFADRRRILELGYSMELLIRAVASSDVERIGRWRFGRYGHFAAIDQRHDGVPDPVNEWAGGVLPPNGHVDHVVWQGEPATRLTFDFAGRLFCVIVPEREFGEQRILAYAVFAITSALLIFVFALVLQRLARAARKVETLHREAASRTAKDLSLARVIQLSSLPRAEAFRPAQLDCTFEASTCPAREVGGDFYDLFELPDGRIVFLVADVSGKGVPAAMFMHIAVNVIKTVFHLCDDVAEAVAEINDDLCAHNDAEMFVTAWIGVLDPQRGTVDYVNAGHNRPYVVRAQGRVECIDGKGGLFLGIYPGRKYRAGHLALEPGDRLFLYTDGVTEAMDRNRRLYGSERLERVLASQPAHLCPSVRQDVDAYVDGAEQSDDLTILSLAWFGQPRRAERTFPVDALSTGEAMAFLRTNLSFVHAKQVARMSNAVDEMVANVVLYSGAKEFSLVVESVAGKCRVTVSDAGAPYDPLKHVDPRTDLPLQERPIGGLGILMAKRLVTSVTYRREGERNVLTLVQLDNDGGRKWYNN